MKRRNRAFTWWSALAIVLVATITVAVVFAQKGKTGAVDTPSVSCANAGNTSIDLVITAGSSTGAPAGFSVQWMKAENFNKGTDLNGDGDYDDPGENYPGQWPLDDDAAAAAGILCKASFSGNAFGSRYNLGPGESVTVRIGEILLDNGASTSCLDAYGMPQKLEPCTEYVFRVFAHATNRLYRSAWSATIVCKTTGCEPTCDPKVKSQGYWKSHDNEWPTEVLNNGLTIGGITYTAEELLSILEANPADYKCTFGKQSKANGAIQLAHQVIATLLNLANGAGSAYQAEVSPWLQQAETLLTGITIPPVGDGCLDPDIVKTTTESLDGLISKYECED